MSSRKNELLFEGSDWNFELLERTYHAIEDIALNDLGLDVYPNQVEIISSEQMLDAYSSIGMPLMYQHWSFGKRFVHDEQMYRKGYQGLAYEIVINSNPCISYNMEENTMPMQTLVMAHAAFGHNHFFKNNYLFKQWTDAEGILEYMQFAKSYIAKCEEKYGPEAVEEILDAAHALMDHGVFRYRRPPKPSLRDEERRRRERADYEESQFNDLWRTLPDKADDALPPETEEQRKARMQAMQLPQENLLYFLEKHSPALQGWQRELLHIVSKIAQYFYPQKQTKVMNEGCATFVHYYIANRLYDLGKISEGALLEILHSHANVVMQPDYDDPRYSGLNPYALGFEMMQDIRRICEDPTEEDREWFPGFAGCEDWRGVLKDAWANYRDESFILQYLSPTVMRKFRMFLIADEEKKSHYAVSHIHNEAGFRELRAALARSYDVGRIEPDIQVADADMRGDRCLQVQHMAHDHIPLEAKDRSEVLKYIRTLWGYNVSMESIDRSSGSVMQKVLLTDKGEKDLCAKKEEALSYEEALLGVVV